MHESISPATARHRPRGAVLWLTGLSGAGKSTLAEAVCARLLAAGCPAYVLDGDIVRQGLCADLGFSPADRAENVRRIAAVAALLVDAGMVVLCACISPYTAQRDLARTMVAAGEFMEIYCATPLAMCAARDVKGLYAKAQAGLIKEFTGVSSPYEAPLQPDVRVSAESQSIVESVDAIMRALPALRRFAP